MTTKVRLIAIVFAALALVPSGAHLFSMPNKLRLEAAGYLVSQRAYDGWSLFAIVVIGAALSSLLLAVLRYRAGQPYLLPALACLSILGTQAIFWTFVFPANKATGNWTTLPRNWEALRIQWEYGHAGSAVLNMLALILLIVASVRD